MNNRFQSSGLAAARSYSGRNFILRRYASTVSHVGGGIFVFKTTDVVDGQKDQYRIHQRWLRDNCRCSECVNQDTMQRTFETFGRSKFLTSQRILCDDERFEITWSDNHKSNFTWNWLKSKIDGFPGYADEFCSRKVQRFWNRRAIDALWNSDIKETTAPEVPFGDVMNKGCKKGIAKLTHMIRAYGFCFVFDTPVEPKATQLLLEAVGPIRQTHYGGFYDFTPGLAKADTAYTNLALDLHTDTTYFTEPAGLQAFHLLSHTPPQEGPLSWKELVSPAQANLGGQSILVDGFHAAHRLRKDQPEMFKFLRDTCIPWHSSGNEDVAITPDKTYPVFEVHQETLHRIRWNNADRGVLPLNINVKKWYAAAKFWDLFIHRQENQYCFQLEPGRVLIFDNWRILHGRTSFRGIRRICGGYINRDDFISKWKLTNFNPVDVVNANMQQTAEIPGFSKLQSGQSNVLISTSDETPDEEPDKESDKEPE